MRDIRFRVWILPKKKMKQVTGLCYQERGLHIEVLRDGCYNLDDPQNQEFWLLNDEAILMQYTGLKDKNGVEIYEGDILREWENCGFLTSIKYLQNCGLPNRGGCFSGFLWIRHLEDGKEQYDINPGYSEHCQEIIGNIHENSELLTKER